jgi:hypothetical protein
MNTTIEKIQDDILSLPDNEKMRLCKWLAELEGEVWDKEIENDFVEGGRGSDLLNQVKSDFLAGKCMKWE